MKTNLLGYEAAEAESLDTRRRKETTGKAPAQAKAAVEDDKMDIRRMNAELQQRTAQLEAANKELEAFCYSISHDLRAPLRAIRGFAEVLQEQYAAQLDIRGQDFLRRVCDASALMDTLVDDLLKLSRVSRSELRRENIDLSTAAAGIISELRRTEPSRKVEFVVAPGLHAQGDERLMRIALDNLLRNAWKFTGKRPTGRIEFGGTEGGEFFIRDNGVGFDPAYAGRLFGVFQRLHASSEFPGSGVGLAIVQRIVNRHGGKVRAEGAVDRGATFYFTLPPGETIRNNPSGDNPSAVATKPASADSPTGARDLLEMYAEKNDPAG
jgi:light-regulated signal transduction histidine kinase (bacteriophytochrome)